MSSSAEAARRSLAGQIAAHSKWAQHDPVEGTARARAKFLQRFLDEVDPNRELPEAERLRRAEHARRAWMLKLALRSAEVRRKAS
jgi:hypothetical protein